MGRFTWFLTMWHLTLIDSDEPLQPPLSLETPNDVRSVAKTHRVLKQITKALIRLRVCAG